MPDLYIGASGYQYDHWRGVLYPEGLPRDEWLAHYADRFSSVELNTTFYGLPEPDTVASWQAGSRRVRGDAHDGDRDDRPDRGLLPPQLPLASALDARGQPDARGLARAGGRSRTPRPDGSCRNVDTAGSAFPGGTGLECLTA